MSSLVEILLDKPKLRGLIASNPHILLAIQVYYRPEYYPYYITIVPDDQGGMPKRDTGK